MNKLWIISAVLTLAGCADIPNKAAVDDQECKLVVVDNASQSIRAYNSDMHRDAQTTPPTAGIDRDEAQAKAGAIQNRDRRFEYRGSPNALWEAQRKC